MKTATIILPALLLAFTAGCSVKYQCELGQECYNTQDAYDAAVSGAGNAETVMPYGPVKREKLPQDHDKNPHHGIYNEIQTGEWRPYSGSRLTDRPVYKPPTPRRIWIAPWRDDGILRAGQFLFVVQPGGWQFGELDDAGAASQLLSPVHPQSETPKRIQPRENLLPGADK